MENRNLKLINKNVYNLANEKCEFLEYFHSCSPIEAPLFSSCKAVRLLVWEAIK